MIGRLVQAHTLPILRELRENPGVGLQANSGPLELGFKKSCVGEGEPVMGSDVTEHPLAWGDTAGPGGVWVADADVLEMNDFGAGYGWNSQDFEVEGGLATGGTGIG